MSNNLGEQFRDIIENIRATGRTTHSGVVMVSVSIIEEKLALALKAMMISLSNDRYKKLFENYGPLNTFAAKIDMAHALGIIPLDMYEELRFGPDALSFERGSQRADRAEPQVVPEDFADQRRLLRHGFQLLADAAIAE